MLNKQLLYYYLTQGRWLQISGDNFEKDLASRFTLKKTIKNINQTLMRLFFHMNF